MDPSEATRGKAFVSAIHGPVVRVKGALGFSMNEMVVIGEERLLGEVVELFGERATVQVYEDTTGLKPGAVVHAQGLPLFVELGPGIVGHIFDGTQRPLSVSYQVAGPFIERGRTLDALERSKPWAFVPHVHAGETVAPGQGIGEVRETERIVHRILTPPDQCGRIVEIVPEGLYTVDERIGLLEDSRGARHAIKLYQRWPVRFV